MLLLELSWESWSGRREERDSGSDSHRESVEKGKQSSGHLCPSSTGEYTTAGCLNCSEKHLTKKKRIDCQETVEGWDCVRKESKRSPVDLSTLRSSVFNSLLDWPRPKKGTIIVNLPWRTDQFQFSLKLLQRKVWYEESCWTKGLQQFVQLTSN